MAAIGSCPFEMPKVGTFPFGDWRCVAFANEHRCRGKGRAARTAVRRSSCSRVFRAPCKVPSRVASEQDEADDERRTRITSNDSRQLTGPQTEISAGFVWSGLSRPSRCSWRSAPPATRCGSTGPSRCDESSACNGARGKLRPSRGAVSCRRSPSAVRRLSCVRAA